MTDSTFPAAEIRRLESLGIDLLELASQLTASGTSEAWVRAAVAAATATHRARTSLHEGSRPAADRPLFQRPDRVPDIAAPTNRTDILDQPSPPPEPADDGIGPGHPRPDPHSVAALRTALFDARDALVHTLPGLARSSDWKQANAALSACEALAEAIDALSAPGRKATRTPEPDPPG